MNNQLIASVEELLEAAKAGRIAGLIGVFYYTTEEKARHDIAGGVLFHPCDQMTSLADGKVTPVRSTAAALVERKISRWLARDT